MTDTTIECPQCKHWEGKTAPVEGCGLCDGTGRCETFEATHGYSWEGCQNSGDTNVDLCVAAIEEWGACTLGQMVHLAPNRHAENPFTTEQVEQACADLRVAGIICKEEDSDGDLAPHEVNAHNDAADRSAKEKRAGEVTLGKRPLTVDIHGKGIAESEGNIRIRREDGSIYIDIRNEGVWWCSYRYDDPSGKERTDD